MPLTQSSTFETYAATSGHQRDIILAITQQGTTYYFSTRPMPEGINSSPIYPMLLEHGTLKEGINIFTKQWQISDIDFTLSDEPYYPQSGGSPIRVSELLEGLNGEIVKLYQWVDGITDIADCMLIFDGYSLQSLKVNKRTAKFTAKDKSKLWDRQLPIRTVGSVWAEAPNNNVNVPIPILYGDFTRPNVYDDDPDATGLVCAWAYEQEAGGKYVIADHAINGVGSPFRNIGGPTVIPVSLLLSDDDDNGVAWIKAGQFGVLEFFPSATLPNIYEDEIYFESQSDRDNLSDNTISTICDFSDRLSDDGAGTVEGLAIWGIEHESVLRQHLINHGEVNTGYRLLGTDSFPEGEVSRLSFFLYYGTDGVTDERTSIGDASKTGISGSSILDFGSSLYKYPGDETHHADSEDIHTDNPGDAFALGIYTSTTGAGGSDGFLDTEVILTLADVILRYHVTFPFQDHLYVNAAGKEYGSDLAGIDFDRTNPYHQFSSIQDPAFIIESLYRDYIGLTDTEIDIDSFDLSVNEDVESRIQIGHYVKLSKVVQQLSEQSTFVLAASGAGKLRCVPLNDPAPTITTTIKRGQLVGDDFLLSKTNFIINDIDVNSQWQGEFDRFLEKLNYVDANSVTQLQTRRATFYWENIFGTSCAHVAEHYVDEDFGIWSNEHIQVQFETAGFTHSNLHPGDWIKFDSDIDDLKKAFGSSWADRELLVIETEKGMDSTGITAIELYGNGFPSSSPEPSPSPDPSPSPGNPSLSPSDTAPYGRYIYDPITSPKALPLLYTLTDGDTSTEVVVDQGHIALSDQYGLEYDSVVTPDSAGSFRFHLDRGLTGFPKLQHGACRIYYSNDNNSWTQWGTQRTHNNGGMTAIGQNMYINGDGSPSASALFWKVFFNETPGDAGTVGVTEITMNLL